jgi:hypothetical protein
MLLVLVITCNHSYYYFCYRIALLSFTINSCFNHFVFLFILSFCSLCYCHSSLLGKNLFFNCLRPDLKYHFTFILPLHFCLVIYFEHINNCLFILDFKVRVLGIIEVFHPHHNYPFNYYNCFLAKEINIQIEILYLH